MSDLFRETAAGQIIRFLSGRRFLQYPEELPDFRFPYPSHQGPEKGAPDAPQASLGPPDTDPEKAQTEGEVSSSASDIETTKDEIILVDWYTKGVGSSLIFALSYDTNDNIDDPANPQNWSTNKKVLVSFEIW